MNLFSLAVYLKPYRKECVLGPAFKLLEAILELLLPTLLALMINHGVAAGNRTYIAAMGALMTGMSLLGFACSMVCQKYAARASQGFGTLLRNALFRHVATLSYEELDRFGTPSIINRLTSDVNQLQLAVAMMIRLVIRAPFIGLGAIVMSMLLDLRLSLVLMAAAPVLALILYGVISKTSPLYRTYQRKLDRIAQTVSENLTGVRVIRAFAKRREEEDRFAGASGELTDTALRAGRVSSLLSPLTMLALNGAILAILWLGEFRINSGVLTQGELLAFIQYVTQILLALIVVSNLVVIFTKASSCAGRVIELLNAAPSIRGPETPPAAASAPSEEAAAGSASSEETVPAIRFRQVSFGYGPSGRPSLQDISLDIAKGETIGIIGGTGSGKTTFAHLIARFCDAAEGEVSVDGRNVKDYPLQELRRKVGIVPQKSVLFSGTVADNIRFGRELASEEEIEAAASAAQADAFIKAMPDGYGTRVERGGQNLSGGQRQRIAVARALLARPEILILDDSSSALDASTDAALGRAVREFAKGWTVLMITQRAATVRHADRILVFDDGKLAGAGTHDELLRTCGVYREICASQNGSGGDCP